LKVKYFYITKLTNLKMIKIIGSLEILDEKFVIYKDNFDYRLSIS